MFLYVFVGLYICRYLFICRCLYVSVCVDLTLFISVNFVKYKIIYISNYSIKSSSSYINLWCIRLRLLMCKDSREKRR